MRVLAKFIAPLRRRWRPVAIVLLCAMAGLGQAQSAGDDAGAAPPSRVARLSYASGDLGFLPAGAKQWSDANINRPLTTGDRLSTDRDARAELELGGGTLRMDGGTDFGLLDLSDQMAQVELTQGTLNLTVRRLEQGQSYEIDTPTVALVVDRPGTFRVDIDDDGRSTQVTAFDGSATVYGENNAQRSINPGRSYHFDDSSLASVTISDIAGGDAFDAWNRERDRRYASSTTRQYVSDDVVGYQDLDQYGDWQDTSDYGAVWYPTHVAVDWAPYRDGHWAYIAPWGWTWVDDSPWGFAPYHYGRWAYTPRGWGWIPGPRYERAIYAPALVAFVGGGGWSIGIGGPVGWFPLGPGEIYNPWYRCDRDYYARVNRSNLRGRRGHEHDRDRDFDNHYNHYRDNRPLPDQRYVNRTAPRGFTAVSGKAFAGGQRVNRDLLHVDPRKLAVAPVLPRGTSLRPAPVNPAAPRSVHVRQLPVNGFRRDVVARHEPPMVRAAGGGAGPVSHMMPPVRQLAPPSNVRLLNSRQEMIRRPEPRAPEQAGGRRDVPFGTAGPRPIVPRAVTAPNPRGPNLPPNAPIVERRMPPAEPPRAGELPSARFAHPQGGMPGRNLPAPRNPVNPPAPMPRPGVSYISNGAENPPRNNYRGNTMLPRVPQIERAAPASPPPNRDQRSPRFEAPRPPRNEAPPPVRSNPPMPPRVERIDNAPRMPPREQPRPMPEPMRPPPQNFQPRFQPPPRPMPQAAPRMAPQPSRAEPRPAPREERPVKKDDHQH